MSRRGAIGAVSPTLMPSSTMRLAPLLGLILPLLLLHPKFLVGLVFRLNLLADGGCVFPQGLARLVTGLDVPNIVPFAVLAIAGQEPSRRMLLTDLSDHGLRDEALLALEACREVDALLAVDEIAVDPVARVLVDATPSAAQHVVGRGYDGLLLAWQRGGSGRSWHNVRATVVNGTGGFFSHCWNCSSWRILTYSSKSLTATNKDTVVRCGGERSTGSRCL